MFPIPRTPINKIKEENLDYMRRYAEEVLKVAAKGEGILIRIEPGTLPMTNKIRGKEPTPHKVLMEDEDIPEKRHLRTNMAYWDDEKMGDYERVERLAKRFGEEFKQLGFDLDPCGGHLGRGCKPGSLPEFPLGYPNQAGINLRGQLNELVKQARNTSLGRDLAHEHRQG